MDRNDLIGKVTIAGVMSCMFTPEGIEYLKSLSEAAQALGVGEPQEPVEFERENRYTVLKNKDIREALVAGSITEQDIRTLAAIIGKIAGHRIACRGKEPLRCVVIESDWPEYEPVWHMLEERMTRERNQSHAE